MNIKDALDKDLEQKMDKKIIRKWPKNTMIHAIYFLIGYEKDENS